MQSSKSQAERITTSLIDFLSKQPASLILHVHPNDLVLRLSSSRLSVDDDDHLLDGLSINEQLSQSSWWDWAARSEESWKLILQEYSTSVCPDMLDTVSSSIRSLGIDFNKAKIPEDIFQFILHCRNLPLPRSSKIAPLHGTDLCISDGSDAGESLVHAQKIAIGMSPKKQHEVLRMTACVRHLIDSILRRTGKNIQHVVDIGAGQGHLSRCLQETCALHVLSLDSSTQQTTGAERRSKQTLRKRARCKKDKSYSGAPSDSTQIQSSPDGSVTHRAFWLGNEPKHANHPGTFTNRNSAPGDIAELEDVIDDWLSGNGAFDGGRGPDDNVLSQTSDPIPIILVALHACGSLTPTVLRKIAHLHNDESSDDTSSTGGRSWFIASAIVVGCCYNLMEDQDFPLSSFVTTYIEAQEPSKRFKISSGHLQLAAQAPHAWQRTTKSMAASSLAMRKILFRALIAPYISPYQAQRSVQRKHTEPQTECHRLGRIPDRAYTTFDSFLHCAGERLGLADLVDKVRGSMPPGNQPDILASFGSLARRIEVLHMLRCILGPLIESLLILDRFLWLLEHLRGTRSSDPQRIQVQVVNIFDQHASSARNIAIILDLI